MSILDLLAHFANVDATLGLIARVAIYLSRVARSLGAQEGQKRDALEKTLREWEALAESIDPRIRQDLGSTPEPTLDDRALTLAALAERYAGTPQRFRTAGTVPAAPELHHSRVRVAGDRVVVSFGQSSQTRALDHEEIAVSLGDISDPAPRDRDASRRDPMALPTLPTFKVTMLGDSHSGKTMFMAAMYARLRDNPGGISIRAVRDAVDLELGQVMETLYRFHKWPPGTVLDKKYEFELRVRERPVALIDWVDYRGGAMVEGEEKKDGNLLAQRLRDSQAILWMVDMTRLTGDRLDGMRQRIETQVARMAHMCRSAVANHDDPRAWVFVRTKSDTVRDPDGDPNWDRACDELIEHMGDTIHIATQGRHSRAAALPVSAAGRVAVNGAEEKAMGDDPSFVEWPLLLSLAFLLDVEYMRLRDARDPALHAYRAARPSRIEDIARALMGLGPKADELLTRDRASHIMRQISTMHKDIGDLMKGCPPAIKLLHDRYGLV